MIAKKKKRLYRINILSIRTERGGRQKRTPSVIIDHVTLTIRPKGVGGERI